jgi:NAD(P)-dependent dehydrogenase (short-subunit alcohol dehydrogenase family)
MSRQSPDPFRLDDKVAIVTGASSGLGVACAEALAVAGANVALGARRASALAATASLVRSRGARAISVPTDITKPAACENLVQSTIAEFGQVDILVNNAGVASAVQALNETPEEFSRIVEANLYGSFYMATAAAKCMSPGASIVNISSILALTTAKLPQAAYASSKAAVLGLTRDLAQQWGTRRGIRVNAICPGFFPTEMTDGYREGYLDDVVDNRTLLGRPGRPGELAATVVFLAGPGAGYITGATIAVDGGVTIT